MTTRKKDGHTALDDCTMGRPERPGWRQSNHGEGPSKWSLIVDPDSLADDELTSPVNAKTGSFEKSIMMGKVEGKRKGPPVVTWMDSVIEVLGAPLEDLKGDGKIIWRRSICVVSKSQHQKFNKILLFS